MAFSITDSCGGEIAFLQGTVRLKSSVNKRGTLRFSVDADGDDVAVGLVPVVLGEQVFVKDSGGTTIWGGLVDSLVETDLTNGATTTLRYAVTCTDFDQIAQRRLVANSYESQTLAQIVTDLVDNYLADEGVTEGTVQTGPTFTKVVFNYRTIAQALDALDELSGFSWWIDENLALQFRERAAIAAPFDITDANADYRRIRIERRRHLYRNAQYVRAGTDLAASAAETFTGDGERRTFNVSLPFGAVPTVEVDTGGGYATKTVGVNGVASGTDWYYNIGRTEITQDSGGTVLTTSHTLRVTYQGQIPIIVLAEDTDEQSDRASAEGFGSGKYEEVVDAPEIDDDDFAVDRALALLRRHGQIPVEIEYETDTGGLTAGDLQTITLASHGIDAQYLIESVDAADRGDLELRYTVRAVSGEAFGSWTEYFKRLRDAGRDFVIRENETLILLREAKDGVKVADEATASTTTSSGFTVGGATAYVGLCDVG